MGKALSLIARITPFIVSQGLLASISYAEPLDRWRPVGDGTRFELRSCGPGAATLCGAITEPPISEPALPPQYRTTLWGQAEPGDLSPPKATEYDRAGRAWELELGLGASYKPKYSGANASSPRALLWASGEYRTDRWGVFALDAGSLILNPQLRWTVGDAETYGVGLLLGYREGRRERDPGLSSDSGSVRLKGMGNVSAAVDGGVQAWLAVLGVPVFAQLRTALSDDQGTIGVFGIYLPLELAAGFTLNVVPSVTWNNGKQMQTLYGVTPAQSAASGFAPYRAGAGWEKAALEITGDWKIAGPWHLLGGVAYQQLLGNAADSPLVQNKSQWTGLIGLSYQF